MKEIANIYLVIIKKIFIQLDLEPELLSVHFYKKHFTINIEENIVIKIEPDMKKNSMLRIDKINLSRFYIDNFYFEDHPITGLKEATNPNFVVFIIDNPDDLFNYKNVIHMIYENIIDSYDTFGCCSQYLECSDMKKCLNEDIFLSLKCYYKRNLNKGEIFYGINANN